MVQIYRKSWQRSGFISLLCYIRDLIVLSLPLKKIPESAVKLLYGFKPDFIFLCHPRMYQDIFNAAPFLKPIKFFLRKRSAYGFFLRMSPFVLNSVKTLQNVNGFVIGQITFPEVMFSKRNESLRVLSRAILLASKLSSKRVVVGLGGWLPMISRRGASVKEYANRLGVTVTNGHCGTLTSIYLMTEHIARVAEIDFRELTLAIIGTGKMGANVAKAFNNKVKAMYLIDINDQNLNKVKTELLSTKTTTKIETILSSPNSSIAVRDILKKTHLGVCATSAFRNILKTKDMPKGFIAIDDSRPESLPRDPKKERIILEGGLLKIDGAKIDYNFGFGEDDNVFGCLGEAFMLALDNNGVLRPTLGDVDMSNFSSMLDFCRTNGVRKGDLKSMDQIISADDIKHALETRRLFKANEVEHKQ